MEVFLDTYKNGTKYWNAEIGQYVLVKGNVALPLDIAGAGTVVTIIPNVTQTFLSKLTIK